MGQLSFADIELGLSRKPSRISLRLDKINTLLIVVQFMIW